MDKMRLDRDKNGETTAQTTLRKKIEAQVKSNDIKSLTSINSD